ncbi:MAG: DUF86 domain-containing protein [Flavobacteriales bacterium]|nr:DUF86 domain-containing protein [Flavobacteriales bacterium]
MCAVSVKRQDPYLPMYLREMLDACDRILNYTAGLNFEDFVKESILQDAVLRNFEVLGEAGNHVSYTFRKKNKHIPWTNMYSLRNHIAHEYFDVDLEILWEIISQDLAHNARDLRHLTGEAKI